MGQVSRDRVAETVMKTAAQVFRETRHQASLTTGNSDLDSLIDGVRPGQFYVVYADDPDPLDRIAHQLLVHCVLPFEQGGFDGRALYFNVCNYYSRKTLLDPDRLATVAKRAGVDPKTAFQNLYTVSAFNEMQQVTAAEEAGKLLHVDPRIKLVVVHNLTRFLETSKRALQSLQSLKAVLTRLKRLVVERDVALVVTGSTHVAARRRIPKPMGGTFLRHAAGIVVLMRMERNGRFTQVQATLVKHPYKRTPHTVVLDAPRDYETLTGRSRLSFKQAYTRLVDALKRSNGFQSRLARLAYKDACDALLQAVQAEDGAMANAQAPYVLDLLNLMANLHNVKTANALRRRIRDSERRLRVHGTTTTADAPARRRCRPVKQPSLRGLPRRV
jgi:hypothetical protein